MTSEVTYEMKKFRELLDAKGIEWHDASEDQFPTITRTHFSHRGYKWSVVHGYGSYGGVSRFEADKGLLELMSEAVNDGDPVGYLSAEDAMKLVMGGTE